MDLLILETITNVHVTEFLSISAMEELEARPGERSEASNLITFAHLERPAASGLISLDRIEDILVEGCIILVQQSLLVSMLNISKVLVMAQIHSLVLVKTTECFGTAQLV